MIACAHSSCRFTAFRASRRHGLAPHSGLSRDGALDLARIRTVLALRSKFGEPKKTLDDPARYIDPSYRDKAAAAPPAH